VILDSQSIQFPLRNIPLDFLFITFTKCKLIKFHNHMSKEISAKELAAQKEQKEKALAAAISSIEKACGKGTIMTLQAASENMEIDVIPTGFFTLDKALGIGGLPRGRIMEIYGNESSGKTTLAIHMIAAAQKLPNAKCAFIDVEHAFDSVYAKKLGVDMNSLLISQPDYAEQALDIIETLVRSGAVDVVVLDSVAALVPKVEIDGEMEDQQMGVQARLMSKALRKLTGIVSKTKCVVIFINQLRAKIGGMGYGPQETTTGGNALKFYSSIRVEVKRIETLKKNEEAYGIVARFKIVKNKVAPPFKTVDLEIIYGEGISKYGEMIDLGVKLSIIEKSGTWFSFKETRLGQGRENAKTFIKEHPEIEAEITNLIKQGLGGFDGDMIITEQEAA
jgi:recombination protein RecA